MKGYQAMSVKEIIGMLYANASDFGDHDTAAAIEESLLAELDGGRAQLVVEEDCIAVVRPEHWRADRTHAVLWLLFVHPDKRGSGIGEEFVRHLVARFQREYPMELIYNGERRVDFFTRCGFQFLKWRGCGSAQMQSGSA